MKVIEQGVDPETRPVQHRCLHCKTLFEFMPREAQYVADQRDGDVYKIGCPVCRRDCWPPVPRR